MKKRLLSLFLCAVMIFGFVPGLAAAAKDTGLNIYCDGEQVSNIGLPEKTPVTVKALLSESTAGSFQWQIRVSNGVWANIIGSSDNALTLRYAMVANLLNEDGQAVVRCRFTPVDGKAIYSNELTVQMVSDMALMTIAAAEENSFTFTVLDPGSVVIHDTAKEPEKTPAPTETPASEESAAPSEEPAPTEEPAAPTEEPAPAEESAAPADPAEESAAPAEESVVPAEESAAETETFSLVSFLGLDSFGLKAYADEGESTPDVKTTYSVVINYKFENNQQVADSYVATLAEGSPFSATVNFPTVQGYLPYVDNVQQSSYEINIPSVSENVTVNVTYKPTNVNYTVIHYQQIVDFDMYREVERETKQGLTNSQVPEVAKSYEGFYSLIYERPNIAADGSTVIEVYYDRYYYLMTFDLDGGYGTEPIYARYGASIGAITEPTKPGYAFAGWDKTIPTTMPAANTSYKANWTVGEAGFTVVFWYENANDNGYSVAGTYTPADVKPGTEKKSEDYKNQSFTGRDDKHFTYNAGKAETVTVKGDGSTVLNVYYTRNTYTLTFIGAGTERVLACGYSYEHKHTYTDRRWVVIGIQYKGGCYGDEWEFSPKCGKTEHTHSNSCYKTSDLTITAKYQADIHGNFPIKDGNDTIWWKVPQGTETYGNSEEQRYLGSIDTMPGENITFTKKGAESGAKIYYYVETLNGEQGDTTYNGRTYKQYKVIDLEYDSGTSLTYAEEFHPITGFTQGDSNPKLPVGGEVRMKNTNYLYYTRNSYNLSFYNYNGFVAGKGGSVQYEASLNGYDFVPDYPANLEANAYVFAGWYTTTGCYAGSEADLSKMTMPASDMVLYAKWVPNTHTVKFSLDKTAYEKNERLSTHPAETVSHGSKLSNVAEPENGGYTFVGWFYEENGVEKAFDFANMEIRKDLHVYGKWSSNTLKQYTVQFVLQNDHNVKVADDITGAGLAGTTKTFDAKGGTELYADYQEGYFPTVKSQSLLLDIDATELVITFEYVQKEAVPYTVKYINRETEDSVFDGVPVEDKVVSDNRKAVVTETFKVIPGYMPDAYQKRLVVMADGKNILYFYYTKDNEHAYYKITHYTQNTDGTTWTEYASSQAQGDIGTTYTAQPMTIPGFTYSPGAAGEVKSGVLTADGLELKLYYTRNSYPYQVRYLEQSTGNVLHEPKNGSGKYGQMVSESAIDIEGYDKVDPTSAAISIRIETPDDVARLNVITFYYTEKTVEIKYVPVGPAGAQNFGSVDPTSETVKIKTGTAAGSTPTAGDGFKFAGWYKDEACTEPVTGANWIVGNVIKPQKENGMNIATTYYAKFEYDVADLTITKEGCSAADQDQAFIFTIVGPDNYSNQVVIKGNGSVTIKGLKIGEYTIHEESGWSWRYRCADQTVTLQPGVTNNVTMTNTRGTDKWLDDNASVDNRFN